MNHWVAQRTHDKERNWREVEAQQEREYREYIERSNAATRRTIADNARTSALLKQEKAAQNLRVGLAAVRASGITKETALEMVNAVFDDAGKA